MPERVLNAAEKLFFEGKVLDVSLKTISDQAQMSMDEVQALFPSLEDITKALSLRNISKLKEEGMILSKKKGMDALKELIVHDIKFFYRVEIDRELLTPQTKDGHIAALQNFDTYFNTEMPKIYTAFLENNKDLLPSQDIDVRYYAHFIAHSLQFFNFRTLVAYEPSSEGRKAATEQIIGSLFGKDTLDLPNF